MGNFYTNIVVQGAKAPQAISALESEGRRAFVAVVDQSTFVYDELCDEQDPEELRKLAKVLSRTCDAPALAALNHDDDVLWLALARNGNVVNVYDSFPEFSSGGFPGAPSVDHLDALCDAFNASSNRVEIETLLRAPRADVTFEVQRHERLLELLGIDAPAGLMGFRYVSEGELEEANPDIELHEVGEDSDDGG
jgi:hypothetical protein